MRLYNYHSHKGESMEKYILKNALICNPVPGGAVKMDVLIEDGKFAKIAPSIELPGVETRDLAGKYLYPGFIDAHCHIGLSDYAYNQRDYNEKSDPVTPQLRALDAFDPFNPSNTHGVRGGVTSFATGPGSSNVIGGTFIVVKPVPGATSVEEMAVSQSVAMKAALGENPKNLHSAKITSRMNSAALMREALIKAKEYNMKMEKAESGEGDPPAFDMKNDALRKVIQKKMRLKVHCHQANDILTAVRIAKEFDIDITLDHCTEGHLIAHHLGKAGYPAAVGPGICFPKKMEMQNKSLTTAGALAKAGCMVSIITDAPVMEQEYLPLMAARAMDEGMDALEAFKAITINPAKMLGLEDRIGSIEEGKDADYLITTSDPIKNFSANVIEEVFINGIKAL